MPDEPAGDTRRTVRIAVVAVLSMITLALNVPDISLSWSPPYVYGFTMAANGAISGVWPGYAAAKAGVQVGDTIDLQSTPFELKNVLYRTIYVESSVPGNPITLTVHRNAAVREVTLSASRMMRTTAENLTNVVLNVSFAAFILIAASLVLLRPSRLTWAFFAFAIANGAGSSVVLMNLGLASEIAYRVWQMFVGTLGIIGFVTFASRFPSDQVRGWRRTLEASSVVLAGIFFIVSVARFVRGMVFGYDSALEDAVVANIPVVGYGMGLFAFLSTYSAAPPEDRQRIRWVLFGLTVGFGGTILAAFQSPPVWAWNVIHSLGVALPVTIAYTVVRHRVIDVNFLISRTIVYTGITAIVVVVFGIIDWFFNRYLSVAGAGTVAEVAAAIALGFWLQGIHARVDSFIDAVFFRRRHEAEVRLKRLAKALPHASSAGTVAESLVDRAADALDLTSAALFLRDGSGSYALTRTAGWDGAKAHSPVAPDDLLVIQLASEQQPLSLQNADYDKAWMPGGRAHPALAVPLSVRNELRGFTLYGPHMRGDDIDPDEVAVLGELSVGASAAMDHVEAAELRRKIEQASQLEREVETLRAEVAAFRSALAT